MILELFKMYKDNENDDLYFLIKFTSEEVYFYAKPRQQGWSSYMLQYAHMRKDNLEEYEFPEEQKRALVKEVFFYYPREWR